MYIWNAHSVLHYRNDDLTSNVDLSLDAFDEYVIIKFLQSLLLIFNTCML